MHHAYRYIGSLFLTTALVTPALLMAIPAAQEASVQVRVYDRNHKDYHNWDERENRAWGLYLTENHRNSHEYAKSKKREKSEYWNWRHSHPARD
jgi:hypothetical protein